jgi:capsular polysaccharide export protein
MVWSAQAPADTTMTRVEDGFIRSKGLGAELIPALSLVMDRRGIYHDPTRPSDLEHLLAHGPELRRDQRIRTERIIKRIVSGQISKYNLSGDTGDLPAGPKILVIGQVEDDASIKLGCPDICDNLALLTRVRQDNPNATVLYKPHPDVVAGLRLGKIDTEVALKWADAIVEDVDISALLAHVEHVHTLTSLTGFEALLRGIRVTTYGVPFYAGWGLTQDRADIPQRRGKLIDLETLVHRTLIDYPRYFDPVTRAACPVEVILSRIENNEIPRPAPVNRSLSKLQGIFASTTPFWR